MIKIEKNIIISSYLYLAINSNTGFYIASKPLYNRSKKLLEEIINSKRNIQGLSKECIDEVENGLKVSTFQEFFRTKIRLALGDIAYDSKTFDFYLDDVAEFFGLKSKSEIEKKSKTIKYYGSIKVIMKFYH